MAFRNEVPQVSAGSMADIAFLLLIFFLVTTSIETDKGMSRMLMSMDTIATIEVQEKNILSITINKKGDLLVDNAFLTLKDLKGVVKEFIDNGGDFDTCTYCQGNRSMKSSDNPQKAIVSIITQRETSYESYIAVQNELLKAYNELRSRESIAKYNVDFSALEALYGAEGIPIQAKLQAKNRLKVIQEMYPLNITEANRN